MDWQKLIHFQIDHHYRVNLLSPRGKNGFCFTEATTELVKEIASGRFSSQEEEVLVSYTAKATLSSVYRINQYFQFDQQAEKELQAVYRQLLLDIQHAKTGDLDFDALA